MSDRKDTYHLVGVAGVGMNALAQAVLAAGWRVTGSDRYADQGQDLEVLAKLRHAGVEIVPQDGSAIGPRTRAVVVSTAIEGENPDLKAAGRQAIPVLHRSEMLLELVADRKYIAITGTCGKTTVTGMVGWILEQLGNDPTVVNGGAVLNWADANRVGNVRVGRSGWWVVEADESDRSLLRYHPDWAIITNMSADHFSLEETRRLFADFRSGVKCGVVCGDDPDGPWREFSPVLSAQGSAFVYGGVNFRVPVPGRHNAENALQAVVLCERLGYSLVDISAALEGFRGIHRRLEQVGVGSVSIFDDYAHNPAKIAAAWRTVAPHHRRVLAVWRPHGFGPLAQMMDDLTATFRSLHKPDDHLLILPVYYAGGTAQRKVDSDALVERLEQAGFRAELTPDYDQLERRLMELAQPGDAILIMGARDPELPLFARRLAARMKRKS